MPLLDIATAQPCSSFQTNILTRRPRTHFYTNLILGNGRKFASSFSWQPLPFPERVGKNIHLGRAELWRHGLVIKAVAVLESTSLTRSRTLPQEADLALRSSPQSLSEDSGKVEEREKLRRMRISKANKGNTPWNKGKKHSPETLQRIRERTRLAMQDPKVKMKLVNLGHSQSEETRIKIGAGVRLGWEKRREKLMLQETCLYDWQNLIAESARKGLLGEEEMNWDSYKILNEQLEKEWLQSVEQRKQALRPKGSKRAPKSAEQRRKIAQAIAAKWADPGYRNRVCSGLAKFHGIPEGVERRPRRKPSGDGQTTKRSPSKKKETGTDSSSTEAKRKIERVRSKRSNAPLYKDPLVSSKLEMLKNIRAQRAAAENQKIEAISRAKLLIAEAEKAAQALEMAAKTSPLARASLVESRMLIAEAIQSIESIEKNEALAYKDDGDDDSPSTSSEKEGFAESSSSDHVAKARPNGVPSLASSDVDTEGFDFCKPVLPGFLNGSIVPVNSYTIDSLEDEESLCQQADEMMKPLDSIENRAELGLNGIKVLDRPEPLPNGLKGLDTKEAPRQKVTMTKKWVRGRLVEVAEEN